MALFLVPFDGMPAQEVKASAVKSISDCVTETKIADALYRHGVEAQTILTDKGVVVLGDATLARMVGNAVTDGLFSNNINSKSTLQNKFEDAATNVVALRQTYVRPSIMGGYGQLVPMAA